MARPVERLRERLVERIAQIVGEHTEMTVDDGPGAGCRCGAWSLPDHPRHVAEQIVDELGLMPSVIDDAKQRLRYATAMLDWELSQLEGAQ